MSLDRKLRNNLMDQAASGDDAAFGELALDIQDELFRFALAHGLKAADAADATQETFLRAYKGLRSWRVGGDVTGWLYGIAMNVVRESRRQVYRQGSDTIELDDLPEGSDRPGRVTVDVADAADLAIGRQALTEAMELLPRRQHEAVACRYLLGMSLEETADVMGCAQGTIKAAVFAGLENLRKIMKPDAGGREE